MNNIDIQKICEEVIKELASVTRIEENTNLIPIEASGRHVHLSKKHIEELFGNGYEMEIAKELSQPGQYQMKERVRLIGPKGVIDNVAVLGPARDNTQVELSITDGRILGINPPVRNSGDTASSPGMFISSGDKMIRLNEGVIVSNRHIHMSTEDAKRLNVSDKDLVNVKVYSDRPVIFEDVLIRVNDQFSLSMHIDYDEANSCSLKKDTMGEIYV